jgi:hypothetical protein
MKAAVIVCGVSLLACLALAQDTNGVAGDSGRGSSPDTVTVSNATATTGGAFVAPPVLATPAVTSDVVVVETVVTTNTVTTLTTNRFTRNEKIVTTNATLRRFVVDIDTNQVPTRFTSYMSDGSVVVTAAGNVGSLTNRAALSTFNVLLRDVIGNGRRNVNTNTAWRAHGTNGAARLQRVWSAAGTRE